MKPTLSVVTTCSQAISKEFFLKELIESVWDIADEIVIINGDTEMKHEYEIFDLVSENFPSNKRNQAWHDKIKMYFNPWEDRMGCMMGRLQRSLAISHATKDYIMILDSDEIVHEKDHQKIRKCLELGHTAYAWRTKHFYRDYQHIKIPGNGWYNYRANLFKNNNYIFDMHDSDNNYQGTVYANMANKEQDRKYVPLINHPDCKKTSIEIMHYGHVRSKEVYVDKTNQINRSYHPDWKDIKAEEFEWDMSDTEVFNGTHPECMKLRIDKHKQQYLEYYA